MGAKALLTLKCHPERKKGLYGFVNAVVIAIDILITLMFWDPRNQLCTQLCDRICDYNNDCDWHSHI